MSLSAVLFFLCLVFCFCTENAMKNFAVYVPFDSESVYMRLGPFTSLYAMSHRIDPGESYPTEFRGLYLKDHIDSEFPTNGCEMTVLLFKSNTKSKDLPVRYSEIITFLITMVGLEDFDFLYGFEISRAEKNMACKVLAAESVIDRLYKQIKGHENYTTNFHGATMLLSEKKPISIKLVEKTGLHLWNLDVDLGKGCNRFGLNSLATISTALGTLMEFKAFPFNGVRLTHKELQRLPANLPQMIYTIRPRHLQAFINIPIEHRLYIDVLYEIQNNFCLHHIIGIEIVRSELKDRVVVKYVLDKSITEAETKQIDYFIKRLPVFEAFVNRVYEHKRQFAHAVLRTSVAGPAMNLFKTPEEQYMDLSLCYEKGKLPKNIEDATFVFEYKSRPLTSSKKAFAFIHTSPHDSFLKTALLHTTYWSFLVKHHLVQDLLYRIVLKPADGGKSMQYMWIITSLPGKEQANVVNVVLKEMMVFLWMALGGKPERVELFIVHPISLKIIKSETASVFSPEMVEMYMKNPVDEIDTSMINMPFENKIVQSPSLNTAARPLEKEEASVLLSDGYIDDGPKCLSSREEQALLQVEETIIPLVVDINAAPKIFESVVLNEQQLLPVNISPKPVSCSINNEITTSRLIIHLSGIPKQSSVSLSQLATSLGASDYAKFIGNITIYPEDSVDLIVGDFISFNQLTLLKGLVSSLFSRAVVVTVRSRIKQ